MSTDLQFEIPYFITTLILIHIYMAQIYVVSKREDMYPSKREDNSRTNSDICRGLEEGLM